MKWKFMVLAFIMAAIGTQIGLWVYDWSQTGAPAVSGGPVVASASDKESARFGGCVGPVRRNCVVDGDTFWYSGRKIRIADINTPELGDAKCDYERQLGQRAKARLQALLNEGNFTLEPIERDTDQYGRDLRVVTRGGASLGDVLVAEGLAEEWQGYRREWC